MTVLSLHPAKIMTTGEGGAVLTDRDDLATPCALSEPRDLDRARDRRDWTYAMVELGYNYRLTDIAAALGSSQIRGWRVPRAQARARHSIHGSARRPSRR
jgi:dTDP-4-amino-4,6-dideoxygalactose transaminase